MPPWGAAGQGFPKEGKGRGLQGSGLWVPGGVGQQQNHIRLWALALARQAGSGGPTEVPKKEVASQAGGGGALWQQREV